MFLAATLLLGVRCGGPKLCVIDDLFGKDESRNLSSLPPLPTLLSDKVGGDSERAIPLANDRDDILLPVMLRPITMDEVAPEFDASNEVSTSGGSMETLIHPVGVREVLRLLVPIRSDSEERRAAIWNCFS